MPNGYRNQFSWVGASGPEAVNETTAYAPSQVGEFFTFGAKTYQYVKVDTGATSAAASAPAASQIVFWKDKSTFLVTNDSRFGESAAGSARNDVAGVLGVAATAGNYVFVQKGGLRTSIKTAGSPAVGDLAVANSGTASDVTPITAGTAATYRIVGKYRSVAASSLASIDLWLADNE